MSSTLPARPIVFPSRTYNPPQQLQQSLPHQQQPASSSSLPGPSNVSFPAPTSAPAYTANNGPIPSTQGAGTAVDVKPAPTTPSIAPATPQPLTLEQQHITAVDGIVPTLQ